MALNQNHTVEELGGYRCSIVEKNIDADRVQFLTDLLSGNGYTVVCVTAAIPKAKAGSKAAESETEATETSEIMADPKFDLGVTDLLFNPTNAIFGRQLRTKLGNIVSLAYWQQSSEDKPYDKPYFQE